MNDKIYGFGNEEKNETVIQQKKFLDAEGVKYLWSKINMQDYPNNETLMDVIEAIDETKADRSELFSGSWNDLTDKPFYENIEKETVVISPKTITSDSGNSFALRCVSEYDELGYLHDIYVIFDNKLYQCRAGTFTYNGKTVKCSGNLGLAYPQFINETNNIDSHLPFFIEFNTYTVGDKYFNDIYVQDKKSEHTIEVFMGNYDMKRIESKYVFGYPPVEEGQTLVVSALNDDGTPREFEGANVFSGSWNDLRDKPFGEIVTIGTKYIEYQETSVEDNNITVSGYYSLGLPEGYSLVVFDGEQYIAKTIYKIPPTTNPEIIVGNPSLITEPYSGVPYDDNGLPFAIYFDFRTRKTVLLTQDNDISHTIEAYMATYEFKQLEEKLIPDTIARVSDLLEVANEEIDAMFA